MKRLLAAVALGCACGVAGSAEFKSYETRLDVAADGSAQARVQLRLTGGQPGRLRLPVAFPALDGFALIDAPAGVTLRPLPPKDQSAVEIELPEGGGDDVRLAFGFRVPGVLFEPKPEEGQKPAFPVDTRLLRHSFVNTQATPIGDYRVEVRLPGGTVVQKIRDQQPRPKRKEFVPRVDLDRFDGQQGALLQLAGMKQGDRTSMELEVVAGQRSWLWLVAGIALAAAWLVGYRYIVVPEPT
jgi:hypothetical protein